MFSTSPFMFLICLNHFPFFGHSAAYLNEPYTDLPDIQVQ